METTCGSNKNIPRLLGRNSKLALSHKILLYKTEIRLILSYGIQLWGTTSKFNLSILRDLKTGHLVFHGSYRDIPGYLYQFQ